MGAQVYIEAFVDCTEWRWRVYESDPGMLHIEYQEWDDAAKGFRALKDHETMSFSAEYADELCAAIQRVKSGIVNDN